jgi:hypothetical protein
MRLPQKGAREMMWLQLLEVASLIDPSNDTYLVASSGGRGEGGGTATVGGGATAGAMKGEG